MTANPGLGGCATSGEMRQQARRYPVAGQRPRRHTKLVSATAKEDTREVPVEVVCRGQVECRAPVDVRGVRIGAQLEQETRRH